MILAALVLNFPVRGVFQLPTENLSTPLGRPPAMANGRPPAMANSYLPPPHLPWCDSVVTSDGVLVQVHWKSKAHGNETQQTSDHSLRAILQDLWAGQEPPLNADHPWMPWNQWINSWAEGSLNWA